MDIIEFMDIKQMNVRSLKISSKIWWTRRQYHLKNKKKIKRLLYMQIMRN